ncbi:MAG: ribonuclease P protein component [Clostridia bacterium]|nr:ribonuclease P protein component [Clostridia bacterium]
MRNFIKLKTNRDFRRLYGRGKSFVTPLFVLYAAKGRKNTLRLGITAGKKLGGAVERNRAKRVITAAFQMCQSNITLGYDFVIVARSRILGVKSTDAAQLLQKQLMAADLWCSENDR